MNPLFLAPTSLPDTPPVEFIRASACGSYDGVGLRLNRSPGLPFHPVLGDVALIEAIKKTLTDTGQKVLDIYSFYLRPDTRVDDFLPALELGAELGAQYAVVMGDDDNWARQVDNFGRMCDAAARYGLVCTVEFAVIRPLATLAQTVRLISEAGRDNAVACLDPLNFHRANGTAAEVRALDPKLFPYAQVSDGIRNADDTPERMGRMGPNQRCLMGEGEVDMASLLDALPQYLPLSVELPMPKRLTHSPDEWSRITRDNVHAYLARHYAHAQ